MHHMSSHQVTASVDDLVFRSLLYALRRIF
jgi:hypothetical protein